MITNDLVEFLTLIREASTETIAEAKETMQSKIAASEKEVAAGCNPGATV
jgi:hypothetical protein